MINLNDLLHAIKIEFSNFNAKIERESIFFPIISRYKKDKKFIKQSYNWQHYVPL